MMDIYRKVGTGISFSKGRPVLDIFCRDRDNQRRVVKIFDLPMYFYLKEDEYVEEEDRKNSIIGEYYGYIGLFGEKLKKIKVKKISEVRRLGKVYHGYESDLKWDKKCLLDLQITDKFVYDQGHAYTLDSRFNALKDRQFDILTDEGLSISTTVESNVDKLLISKALEEEGDLHNYKPKIGSEPFEIRHGIFDIEVVVEKRGDLKDHIGKVICVVIWDSYTNVYHKLRIGGSERIFIEQILEKFKELDFDIISGWNVKFDMGWLISKAQDYNLDLSIYFPGGKTFISQYTDFEGKFKESFYIGGRILLDGMDLYIKKTITTEKLSSYNLKSVAAVEKLPEWEDLGHRVKELWDNDPLRVIEYCRLDVERTMQIIKKKDLLGGALTTCKFFGCGFDDVTTNSKVIDCLMFLLKRNRVLPNIVRGREKAKIIGAKVLETKAGVHKNVGIFDAASLYPSIIQGLNVSPECLRSGNEYENNFKSNVIAIKLGNTNVYMLRKDIKMGLMTEVITEMRKLREQIRDNRAQATKDNDTEKFALHNNEEKVAKGVLASVYGVMGFSGFRLFNEDCANIITKIARDIILLIVENLESSKFHVIAGDTDSVFIQMNNVNDGFEAVDKIHEMTNDYMKKMGVDDSIVKINYEKFFKWVMFNKKVAPKLKTKLYRKDIGSAKKKYIGFISHVESGPREMKEVNELYYKGFELRRSDSAKVLKDVMRKFFNLMEDGDYHKSISYLKKIKDEFHTYDMDYVSMPRSVNVEEAKGPWSDGYRYAKTELKFEFEPETMPKLIYVENQFKYPKTKVICYQDGHVIPPEFKIDYNTMFDKIIKAKFEPILESLDMFWDVAINNQVTLDTWA